MDYENLRDDRQTERSAVLVFLCVECGRVEPVFGRDAGAKAVKAGWQLGPDPRWTLCPLHPRREESPPPPERGEGD